MRRPSATSRGRPKFSSPRLRTRGDDGDRVRALLRADRADDELARALARAGLYVERLDGAAHAAERLAGGDVAVIDPRLLANAGAPGPAAPKARPQQQSLETLCYEKLAQLLERLGDQRLPALYDTVLAQMERALLRLTLARDGSVAAAAQTLGIHRNTLARRLDALGLREKPSRVAAEPAKRAPARAPSRRADKPRAERRR